MADKKPLKPEESTNSPLDIVVRTVVVLGLLLWCIAIFRPFLLPVLWGVIIAVALYPLFHKLVGLMAGKRKLTATLFTLVVLALVIVPTAVVVDSVVKTTRQLAQQVESQTMELPPPSEKVKSWPVIGERAYDAWALASTNLETALKRFEPQLKAIGARIVGLLSGLAGAVVQSILAIIIAGLLLATADKSRKAALSIARRLGGETAEATVDIAKGTIRSVAQGVLGVALVQGLLAGIGLFAMGVPAAGLWTIVVMILALIQIPPTLVLIPIIIYVFSTSDSTLAAVIFMIWSLIAGMSDNVLKPLFLGRGVAVPMPVILLGAIGGLMLHGFIGLFVGAVVLAIGYDLVTAWLDPTRLPHKTEPGPSTD